MWSATIASAFGCASPDEQAIEGTVVDLPHQTPVAGALVRGEGGHETRTDSHGRFRLSVPHGRQRLLRAAHGENRCPGEARIEVLDAAGDIRIGLSPRLLAPEDQTNVGFDEVVDLEVATPCDEAPIVRWNQEMGPTLGDLSAEEGGRRLRIRTHPPPEKLPDGFVALTPATRGEYRLKFRVDLGRGPSERTVRITSAPMSSGLPNVPVGVDQYVAFDGTGEWSASPQVHLEVVSDRLARFRATKRGGFWVRRGDQTSRGLAASFTASATCMVDGCHRTVGIAWRETAHHRAAVPDAACNECHASGGFALAPVERGVGCVACHGPGHPGDLAAKAIWDGRACTPCHDAREGPNSPHDSTVVREWSAASKNGSPAITSPACARCHTGQGLRDAVHPNSSGVSDTRLGCPTCHDPHGTGAPFGLRIFDRLLGELGEMPVAGLGTGAVCAQCHSTDVPDIDGQLLAPHAPQTNLLIGRAAMLRHRATEVGPHTRLENSCVACHMARPDDERAGRAGGHTFSVRDLQADADLIVSSACDSCHGSGVPASAIGGLQDRNGDGVADGVRREFDREFSAIRAKLRERIGRARIFDSCPEPRPAADVAVSGVYVVLVDSQGTTLGDCNGDNEIGRGETPVHVDRLSRHLRRLVWDTLLLERDGSHGLHNPGFAFELLQAIREGI